MASNSSRPSDLTPTDKKLDLSFGLQYAKYIHNNNYADLDTRRAEWKENIEYLQGYQNMDKIKQFMLDGRDKSFGKLNFDQLNIIPKYCKIGEKNLAFDLYQHKATAIDPFSMEIKKEERDKLVGKMINGTFNERMSQVTGIDFRDKGFIPSEKEDIDIFMETEFKLPHETAMEQAISVVHEANYYSDLRHKGIQDLMTCGKVIMKDGYDPLYGVAIRRINPINFITSFDPSEVNDNRGSIYNAHYEFVSIADLSSKLGLKPEEAVKFAKATTKQTELTKIANRVKNFSDIESSMVEVLFFEFKTTVSKKYKVTQKKKSGKVSVEEVNRDYYFEVENDFEKISMLERERDVWVEGAWIVDSDIVLNYGIKNNQVITSLKEVRSSYSVYDTDEMPFVRKLIPFANKMVEAAIKLEQMMLAARPKGLAINITALSDIPNGSDDGTYSFLELIRMFNESGNQLFRQDEFSAGQGLPLVEIENGMSNDALRYIDIWNFNLQQIHNIVGINPQMAGAGAVSRTSTESNQMAMESSIKSIEYLRDALLSCEKRMNENIVLRIQDIDKYDKPFKKYAQAMGKYAMRELMSLDKLHPFTFSLYVEMLPDVEERKLLLEDLSLAIQKGEITTTDKMDVQQIKNLKLASLLLKRRIKENRELAQKSQLEQIQASQQATLQKAQMEQQNIGYEYQLKSQLSQQEFEQAYQIELLKLQAQTQMQESNAYRDFQKQNNDIQSRSENVRYQQAKMDYRQTEKLEAMKNNELSKDSIKSMKK